MKTIILAGLITANLSSVALAANDPIKCDPGGKQIEMTACVADDYKAADKVLNSTWKALINMKKENKGYIEKIKVSQNLWIKFRDAEVAAQFACDEGDERTCWGSMYPMLKLTALTEITEERTKRLQGYIDTDPESALTSTDSTSDCYIHKGPGEDKAAVQIDQDGDAITGYFTRAPDGKDGAYGDLKGSNVKGLILAEYTYDMEGDIYVQDVQFRSEGETLIEGRGELIESKGKLIFKDKDAVKWGDVYTKTDCKNIKKLIDYSRDAVDALRSQQQ